MIFHPESKAEKMWSDREWSIVLDEFLALHPDFDVVMPTIKPFAIQTRGASRVRHLPMNLPVALAAVRHADLFIGVNTPVSCTRQTRSVFQDSPFSVQRIPLCGDSEGRHTTVML